MLLGKNAEFFRQKEKPLGLVKSNDGDGGLHGTGAMPLPGMRQVLQQFVSLTNADKGQDFPHHDITARHTECLYSRFNRGKLTVQCCFSI